VESVSADEENVETGGPVVIVYAPHVRHYGILYTDGTESVQSIAFCPWCGTKLPSSLADEWFQRLESLGLELGDVLPSELQSDEWWLHDYGPDGEP
jgi:hypothetical protein